MGHSLKKPVGEPTYLEFFGLRRPPFARLAKSSDLFHTEQYSFLMEHLVSAGKHADSLLVLCGADGSGKSTLLNRFIGSLDEETMLVAIDETCLGGEQFYSQCLAQIGFKNITGTADELKNITSEFIVSRGNAGDRVLIIIDNAHAVNPIVLEQLRLISEIKTDNGRAISVILTGSPDLIHIIDGSALRGARFNSHVVFNIRNYTEGETASYIWHRLGLVGGTDRVKVSKEAYPLIHRYSGGIPHLINKLCDDLLTEAYETESHDITEKIVRSVADKKGLLPHVIPNHNKGRRRSDPEYVPEQDLPVLEERITIARSESIESPEDANDQTITFNPKHLLRKVSQLSEQVEGLRTDKMRALREIEARNKHIIKLRDELNSKTGEVEVLSHSLKSNADEFTQRNRALSEKIEALQHSADTSKDFAYQLEQETRARKAAEEELAQATSTVDELSQLKDDLLASIDNLETELHASDKQSDEVERLEQASDKLKEAIEEKTSEIEALRDELAARDEAQAELANKLDASQIACDEAEGRIAALENPEELQKIEEARDQLAAHLEQETIARQEAEEELTKVAATVDELSQLNDELLANNEILEAERKEAIEEKTAESETLQDELAARDEARAELEKQLEASQQAYEEAEGRIAALENPEELQKIEDARDQLAADLEQEVAAKQATDEELAKATATVDELAERVQELETTVTTQQAELEVAEERTVEFEDLEKTAAGLSNEIEDKSAEIIELEAELASRNEILADLEDRFAQSQSACELAQLRILELKSPQELEEMEQASDRLAADLEQESVARKTAEEKLSQLKEEMEEAVDRLQSELEQAEKRAVEVDTVERNEELEETRNAANRLAVELDDEKGKREGAEKELAGAVARIDDLSGEKEELQATVRDLNLDLQKAGELVVDYEVLERSVAELKADIHSKTRELDSRGEAIARLEERLASMQSESESRRPEAAISPHAREPVPGDAGGSQSREMPVYTSLVVQKFVQSISDVPAYKTLQECDPGAYKRLIKTYKELAGLGQSEKEINDAIRAKQAKLIEKRLPRASDEALLTYARVIVDQLDEFLNEGTEPCFSLLVPKARRRGKSAPALSERMKDRELDVLDLTLSTYAANRKLPAAKKVWPSIQPIFADLISIYGEDSVSAIERPDDSNIDREELCRISRSLYSGILELPKGRAASALRWLVAP